ncbi:hypothetical protein [Vibrio vulnificus YJ016]|uniref:Uncharacterized protein n=1 Tax=Vibrio vulnificus (strain YJ016) TaxID=196600 RepID=Q7MCK9_VIBVY|nr:hypothetical protein [Vibrio vulnificus YJ016]
MGEKDVFVIPSFYSERDKNDQTSTLLSICCDLRGEGVNNGLNDETERHNPNSAPQLDSGDCRAEFNHFNHHQQPRFSAQCRAAISGAAGQRQLSTENHWAGR